MQVHEETTAYRETLQFFEAADALTWEGLVAVKRKDLTTGFFEFLTSLVDAAHKDKSRQEGLSLPSGGLLSLTAVGLLDSSVSDAGCLHTSEPSSHKWPNMSTHLADSSWLRLPCNDSSRECNARAVDRLVACPSMASARHQGAFMSQTAVALASLRCSLPADTS